MSIKEYLATNKKPTRNKWNNEKTEFNGFVFDSKKEANFAIALETAKKAHDPKDRVLSYRKQVPFKIKVNGYDICKYILDFEVTYADGHIEYIDVKAFDKRKSKFLTTDVYRLKKKLLFATYGIEIKEM